MASMNSFWDWVTGTNKQGPQAGPPLLPYDYSDLYQKLYDLYNNDDTIAEDDTTRRLRTVVNRSVEFYASKMLPGAKIGVAIAKDKPQVLQVALERIIRDSNLGNNKPAMLRGFSLYGDSFIRVRGDNQKSYMEDISPFYATDFGEDSRGFLTYMRIDIPILDAQNRPANYTEYWDLAAQKLTIWTTTRSASTPLRDLGTPQQVIPFSALGVTFIPIVHTKFRDNGDQRGLSCVYHALDKIYEANRMATRLHDLVFRFGKPAFIVSANASDAAGRPLPPPSIDTGSTGNASASETNKEGPLGDWHYMPGVSTLESLIPNIDYSDILAILNAQMEELEKDLPELRWYSLSPTEQTAMSGTALRTLLGAAVDRANEARHNFLSSLSRALEMALTIGQFNQVYPAALGRFDTGDFEHELVVDDSWGESIADKSATMQAMTSAGVPPKSAMLLAGFSQEQVDQAFPAAPEMPPQTGQGRTGLIRTNGNTKSGLQVVRVG